MPHVPHMPHVPRMPRKPAHAKASTIVDVEVAVGDGEDDKGETDA
jgi:hypothetical protein